ncbi:MAG: peptidyl-prolyl cis-trans isomerase family protein [Phenylobacterium sp.]|nr:peptidyl-prolyl cis-trans isomerase family protein [Phenylobacterium sp.]
MRPLEGMISTMKRARSVTSPAARGAALSIAVAAACLPLAVPMTTYAQDLRGPLSVSAAAPAPQAAAPAPARPRGVSESVAAIVNDEIISTYDLGQRVRLLIATSGVQPTEQTLPQFEREALVSLIDERLQLQELKRVEKEQKFSIIASDDEVNAELESYAKQNNMNGAQFLTLLGQQGVGADTFRQQLRAQISWQTWIRGRYGSRLRIGEDQIKAMLQRMASDASKPQYQISEVFIDSNRVGGRQTALNGAQQLVVQLQQGAPFAAVARQFSASATAAAGGEAGWVSPGEMPAEVDAALEQLRPGQLSAPIPVKDGVYIIYLKDKRSGAGDTLVALKQAAVALPTQATAGDIEAARVKLEALRVQIKGCENIEKVSQGVPGVVAGDLGEAQVTDLAPAFREVAETLKVGEVSAPIRTNVGLHLVAVCGKRASGGQQVTHDQIENRLYGQQLSMISRRYMRDLRTSATIETR